MPMHDWSKVDANVFHDFHQTWAVSIRNALNAGILPEGFSALVEQHAGATIPDVLAVERRVRKKPQKPGGGLLVKTQPATWRIIRSQRSILADRGNRIVVKHRLGDVVCVIEIMSPGTKDSKKRFRQFVDKAVEFLVSGVHLLIVDLLPPTPRDPQGIHNAIWDEIEGDSFVLPADKQLTLAAYESDYSTGNFGTNAYVQPVAVGDILPDMPAYLEPGAYVPVPLEATYQAAWATCPADMRELVETGKLSDE